MSNANWIAEAAGKMKVNGITGIQVAKKMGVSQQWLSYLLNGKRSTEDAEQRVMTAINEIITEQQK